MDKPNEDKPPEKHAFEVQTDVVVKMEPELAISLGKLILETDTKNTALLALAHRLRRIRGAY